MVLGIVVQILFEKSRVFDVAFHLVRPFYPTMEVPLIVGGLKFAK